MKIFISQPMANKTNEQIKAERLRAEKLVKNKFNTDDIEILDSFFEGAPHDANPLWFLGKSIQILSQADVVLHVHLSGDSTIMSPVVSVNSPVCTPVVSLPSGP